MRTNSMRGLHSHTAPFLVSCVTRTVILLPKSTLLPPRCTLYKYNLIQPTADPFVFLPAARLLLVLSPVRLLLTPRPICPHSPLSLTVT